MIRYNDFIKWNLAGIPSAYPTMEGSEYNDSGIINADKVFQLLRHHGRFGFSGWKNLVESNYLTLALYVHSKNEYIFRRHMQNKSMLDYYDDLDHKIVNWYSKTPSFMSITMEALNQSIDFFQDLGQENFYDVKHWTRGYEGKMGFLGATTPINPNGGDLGGYYRFPEAQGTEFINVGDIVTNRIPIGLYASPIPGIEYCLRQSMYCVDNELIGHSYLDEDFSGLFARTVFFEIDLITIPNVAPIVAPSGKEILKKKKSYFKVTNIDESTINGKSICLVVSLQELDPSTIDITKNYQDFIDGELVTEV